MSLARPITPDSRAVILAAAPGQTRFWLDPATPVWDGADIVVHRRVAGGVWSRVSGGLTVTLSEEGAATIDFGAAPRPTAGDPAVELRVVSARWHQRTSDVTRAGVIRAQPIEDELDQIATTLQELRRDADLAVGAADAADAAAASAAAAAAAATQAQAYRDAVAGMGLTGHVYATRAAAAAATIAAGVPALRITADGADYASTPSNPGHVLGFEAPTGSGRWWLLPASVTPHPGMAGGVGDNIANDQAALDALAVARPGGVVDLLGKTWLVSSFETGFQPINGALRVGTETRRYGARPKATPFEGGQSLVLDLPGQRRPYPGGMFYRDDGTPEGRELVLGVVSHAEHVTNPGDGLTFFRSLSGGVTFSDEEACPVPITEGVLGGSCAGAAALDGAAAGVFGFLLSTIDAGSVKRLYRSASSGAGWTLEQITGAADIGSFLHGDMLNIPASDGGGAAQWIVAGYSESAPYAGVHVLFSTNAWVPGSVTAYVAKAQGAEGISDATEAVIVRTGPNAWWLIARRDGAGLNYVAAFSATPKVAGSWGPWIDTGVKCNGNPHHAFVEWGRLWLLAFARRSSPIDGYEDALIAISTPATGFAGQWPSTPVWAVVTQGLAHMTGDANLARLPGGDLALAFSMGETVGVGSFVALRGALGLVTSRPAPVAAPALVRPRGAAILNPDPALLATPYGAGPIAVGGSKTRVGAGLWMARSGAALTATREAVDWPLQQQLGHAPAQGWRLSGAAGPGFILGYRVYGEAVRRIARAGMLASRLWMSQQVPGYYRASAIINPGTGGTPVTPTPTESANAKQLDYVTGLYRPMARLALPEMAAADWGTNNDATLDLIWTINNTAATSIYGMLHGVVWNVGDEPAEIEPYTLAEAKRQCADRVERFDYTLNATVAVGSADASDNALCGFDYEPKRRAPTISIASGYSVANFAINGATCNALSFDDVGPDSATIIARTAGTLVTHSNQRLKCASPAASILIDAEDL